MDADLGLEIGKRQTATRQRDEALADLERERERGDQDRADLDVVAAQRDAAEAQAEAERAGTAKQPICPQKVSQTLKGELLKEGFGFVGNAEEHGAVSRHAEAILDRPLHG